MLGFTQYMQTFLRFHEISTSPPLASEPPFCTPCTLSHGEMEKSKIPENFWTPSFGSWAQVQFTSCPLPFSWALQYKWDRLATFSCWQGARILNTYATVGTGLRPHPPHPHWYCFSVLKSNSTKDTFLGRQARRNASLAQFLCRRLHLRHRSFAGKQMSILFWGEDQQSDFPLPLKVFLR